MVLEKIPIANIEITSKNVIDDSLFGVEIYVCGCDKRCEGCHNSELQSFNPLFANNMSIKEIMTEIKNAASLCDMVIYVGGDFGCYPEHYKEISKQCRKLGLTNLLYTGKDEGEISSDVLRYTDFVLYGKYNPDDPDKKKQFTEKYMKGRFYS